MVVLEAFVPEKADDWLELVVEEELPLFAIGAS
jgi:hypothetical protein